MARKRRGACSLPTLVRSSIVFGILLYAAYLFTSFRHRRAGHRVLPATQSQQHVKSPERNVRAVSKPSQPAMSAPSPAHAAPGSSKAGALKAGNAPAIKSKPAEETSSAVGGNMLLPVIKWPAPQDRSSAICVSRDGNESRLVSRTCFIFNACIDTAADTSVGSTRWNRVVMFSGQDAASSSAGSRCIPASGVPAGKICAGEPVAYAGSLNHNNFIMRARIDEGGIPSQKVAQWLNGSTILLSRHYTSNLAHSLSDDIWPVWKIAQRLLGWDPITGGIRTGAGGSSASGTSFSPLRAGWLDWNTLGTGLWLEELYRRLLPGIPMSAASDVAPVASQDRPLLCSRGPLVIGIGDEGMMRNAHYGFHQQWTFSHQDKDWQRVMADYLSFRDRYRAAYKLPALSSVPPALTGDGKRGIIIVNRVGKTSGSEARTIDNVEQLKTAVEAVAGGRPVKVRDWKAFSDDDNTVAVDASDVIIALHGAGNMMMLASRPGTAWLELMPPRATPVVGIYRGMAQRLGLRYFMQTLSEHKCDPAVHFHMQDAFTADVESVAAHVKAILASSSSAPASGVVAGSEILSLIPGGEARKYPKLSDAVNSLTSRPVAWMPAEGEGAVLGGAIHAVTACRSGVRTLHPPASSASSGPQRCGDIVILLPEKAAPHQVSNKQDLLAALSQRIALDQREHFQVVLESVPGSSVGAAAGSVAGEGRTVSIVTFDSAALQDPDAVSSFVSRVGRAELIVAPHGSGLVALLGAAAPGTHWIDLVPPRAHSLHSAYLPASRSAGVHLHTLMMTEADCKGAVIGQASYAVEPMALASVVALALRSEL